MRILTVIGNRPQFVKAAAVSRVLRQTHEERIVHTGQHYDDEMSKVFFEELDVPRPDRDLHAGGGTNSAQTARLLEALEGEIAGGWPEMVLVYGDTNSTLAGALAAAQAGVPLGHVEAGMRSFDRTMPEELNRVLTDHASDLLLCSTQTALDNLARESAAGKAVLVGDVMADVSLAFAPIADERSTILDELAIEPGGYLVVTAHRPGNVDRPEQLERLVGLLEGLPLPIVLPLHPRTAARLDEHGLRTRVTAAAHITLAPPLGYLDFTKLARHARAILTDSGGVQKEAYLLGVPCVTLRETTEWIETVETGWNVLVGLDSAAALAAIERGAPDGERPDLYGDGRAAERISEALAAYTHKR